MIIVLTVVILALFLYAEFKNSRYEYLHAIILRLAATTLLMIWGVLMVHWLLMNAPNL